MPWTKDSVKPGDKKGKAHQYTGSIFSAYLRVAFSSLQEVSLVNFPIHRSTDTPPWPYSVDGFGFECGEEEGEGGNLWTCPVGGF